MMSLTSWNVNTCSRTNSVKDVKIKFTSCGYSTLERLHISLLKEKTLSSTSQCLTDNLLRRRLIPSMLKELELYCFGITLIHYLSQCEFIQFYTYLR